MKKVISQKESLMFGLFFGFLIMLMMVTVNVQSIKGYTLSNDSMLRIIFPIFRAPLLIILYFWLLGWNIYGWTKYNVNYKLIFHFKSHYSKINQIMKRNAFFTLVWCIAYLYFVAGNPHSSHLFTPQYIPTIVWIVLITYLSFPSSKIFNGKGRIYVLKYLYKILFFFINDVSFIERFISDQFVSFVAIIKDIYYTICFYS